MVVDTRAAPKLGIKGIVRTMDPMIRLLLVIGLVEMTAVNFYASVLMPYYKSLGYQSGAAGILTSILQVTSAVVLTAAGFAADRFGRKKLYVAGQAARCLVAASLLMARNFAGLVVVSVLRGLASIQSPAQSAIFADCTQKSSRATILGLSQTFSQLASFLSPLAAGVIADKMGVRIPFAVGLTLAAVALALGTRVKVANSDGSTPPVECGRAGAVAPATSAEQPEARAASEDAAPPRPQPWRGRVREMFSDGNSKALWFVLMANAANGLANGATGILLPYTIMDRFSSAYQSVSAAQAAGALGTMLVLLIGGRIADTHGRKGIISWSSVLFPLALCSIFFAQSLWHIYAVLLIVTMLGNISTPAIMAIHMEIVADRHRASFSGLCGGVTSASLALGSALAGFGYSASPTLSWAATIILFAGQGLMYYMALSSRERTSEARAGIEPA